MSRKTLTALLAAGPVAAAAAPARAAPRAAATAKDTLQQVHDRLAAADGNGVAAAPLTDMQTALSNAQCGTGSLLGLSAGPDASAIASAVKAARSGLGTCRTALKKALSDAKSA